MAEDLTEFRWRVPSAGYRWTKAKTVEREDHQPAVDRFLIPQVRLGEMMQGSTEYEPFHRCNGLFRTLAETDTSEAGVLAFANTYGCLGGNVGSDVLIKMPGGRRAEASGERRHKWVSEILRMRTLVTLWELIKKGDESALMKIIEWKADGSIFYRHPDVQHGPQKFGRADAAMQILPNFQTGDRLLPALCFLQKFLNEKLVEHGVHAHLLWDARYTKLGLHLVPKSLIACLWLQFAKAIEGDKTYRQCEYCRRWFEVGGSRGARADKRFCSPSCKATAHRKKREEALHLFATKMPVKEIARRLDTDPQTVKTWISK